MNNKTKGSASAPQQISPKPPTQIPAELEAQLKIEKTRQHTEWLRFVRTCFEHIGKIGGLYKLWGWLHEHGVPEALERLRELAAASNLQL